MDTLQNLMQDTNATLRIRCDLEVFVKRHNVATGKDTARMNITLFLILY